MPLNSLLRSDERARSLCAAEADGRRWPAEPGGYWLPTDPPGENCKGLNGAASGETPGPRFFVFRGIAGIYRVTMRRRVN
jgi:hypothetical protein